MCVKSNEMPSSYRDCKLTMRYRKYMQWEIVYLTADIEVTCQYLHEFVKDCINYKWLDLLLKIVNKCKRPLAKYVAHQGFWEDKIKHWRCQKQNGNVLLLNKNEMNKQTWNSKFFFSLKCVLTIVAMPCTVLADILVTILNIVQFVSLVRTVTRMTASTVHVACLQYGY